MSHRDGLALTDYLEHIRQAIGRIQRYLGNLEYSAFVANDREAGCGNPQSRNHW